MTDAPAPVLRSLVYGAATPDLDDPAEIFHEASRLYPALAERQGAGISQLAASPALQEATLRAVRRNPHLPRVRLTAAEPPDCSLWSALERRRSRAADQPLRLPLAVLGLVLRAAYGPNASGRRTTPSGGALYPLELYAVAQRVEGLEPGVYHLDPARPALERVPADAVATALAEATPLPELVTTAAAVLFLTAVFWRTRVKYGLRGYRFALLEAGHVAQNVLLAATALELPALPLGGFYDARVDELLGVDGVDESVLYGVVLGGRAG
ncbi:MAG TPA: SagB/ThcOx family dehydrogenase [Gaiellaceae bacterium]|nr:SagB/ThcOx family dehydrogenase [Gaiellaceae bacterium]